MYQRLYQYFGRSDASHRQFEGMLQALVLHFLDDGACFWRNEATTHHVTVKAIAVLVSDKFQVRFSVHCKILPIFGTQWYCINCPSRCSSWLTFFTYSLLWLFIANSTVDPPFSVCIFSLLKITFFHKMYILLLSMILFFKLATATLPTPTS